MDRYFALSMFIILWSILALADIVRVPQDQLTIQAGIDAAVTGDTVLVADNTYFENINFKGRAITVASHYLMDGDTNHINNTIIDGSQPSHSDSGSVVYFVSGEDTNSVLTGFTITGGKGTGLIFYQDWLPSKAGGGIFVFESGAKIEKNKIVSNNCTATGDTVSQGAAIIAFGEAGDFLIIRDNLISGNSATATVYAQATINWGTVEACIMEKNRIICNTCNAQYAQAGALYVFGHYDWQGIHSIRDNIIKNNVVDGTTFAGAGAMLIENCSPVVANNIISDNSSNGMAGGIWVNHWTIVAGIPKPVFINNTITNNTATNYGGGFFIGGSPQAEVKILNTILWGNNAVTGSQIYISSSGGSVSVRYSDLQGDWPGDGNIDADPLIVADSLSDSSSCIGAGISQYDFGGGVALRSPATDINGRMRPYPSGSNPDIGAWESPLDSPFVGIEKQLSNVFPKAYSLNQNYPNPFNPTTTIKFALPHSGFVTMKVYNILGEEVSTLVSKKLAAGKYKYEWDASGLASGVYLYRIEAGSFIETRKLILLK